MNTARPPDPRNDNGPGGTEPNVAIQGTSGNAESITPTEKMRRAKLALSHAAVLALANDELAEQSATDALKQIDDARRALAAEGDSEKKDARNTAGESWGTSERGKYAANSSGEPLQAIDRIEGRNGANSGDCREGGR